MVCDRFLCGQFRDSLIILLFDTSSLAHSFVAPNRVKTIARSALSTCSTRFTHFARFKRSTRFASLVLFPAFFELQVRQFPYSRNTRLPLQDPNLKQ